MGSVLPHLRSGKLTALAVASRQRSALLPQVPTFEETGIKGFVIDTWYGLLAPAGTPADALRVLTKRRPTSPARLPCASTATAGLEPQGSCGEPFAAQIAREIETNTRIARELDLKVEWGEGRRLAGAPPASGPGEGGPASTTPFGSTIPSALLKEPRCTADDDPCRLRPCHPGSFRLEGACRRCVRIRGHCPRRLRVRRAGRPGLRLGWCLAV
ncbi:MAG: tripartite tricarboxylate transporter substrate-binding protein [Rubrivivax sp.]